jgi:hypothetical protein
MIQIDIRCDLHEFAMPVDQLPNEAIIRICPQPEDSRETDMPTIGMLTMNRADACRLLVSIRGWLFATAEDAVKAGCYCDDEITN